MRCGLRAPFCQKRLFLRRDSEGTPPMVVGPIRVFASCALLTGLLLIGLIICAEIFGYR